MTDVTGQGGPRVHHARPEVSVPGKPVRTPARHLWHVTLTVVGDPCDPSEVRAALERLTEEQPFLLAARYGTDRAELQYWEEARDLEDAAALALRLWGEHRSSAGLPPWRVAGLEVVDRETHQHRSTPRATPPLVSAGRVRPL